MSWDVYCGFCLAAASAAHEVPAAAADAADTYFLAFMCLGMPQCLHVLSCRRDGSGNGVLVLRSLHIDSQRAPAARQPQ